ncbi:MAG: hypothetical protein ORN24_06760 [Burkholderiales bacterium]|nr:hypothetical protein [Burkholderiales bacterium]
MNKNIVAGFLLLFLLTNVNAKPSDGKQQGQSNYQVIFNFVSDSTGARPMGLFLDSDNSLYGTTIAGGSQSQGIVYKLDANHQFKQLHDFVNPEDGAFPNSALILNADGYLYGTTVFGGSSAKCDFGCGTIYKIDKNGNEQVLHSFDNSDGSAPYAKLTIDKNGMIYGVTSGGGNYGGGTIFQITPQLQLNTLFSFTKNDMGYSPQSALVLGADGEYYGTTLYGDGGNYYGSIFKMDQNNNVSVVHSFTGSEDGSFPNSEPILAKDGSLYGTTNLGGDAKCNSIGCGTVYKLTPSGQKITVYAFQDRSSGIDPSSNLVMDSAGNLYGATNLGGKDSFKTPNGFGVIYKIDVNGNYSVIHEFQGGNDGYDPEGNLVIDSAGNIYGTTFAGGTEDLGTVFEITTTGK